MSYSIKADSTFLRTADTQNVSAAKGKSYNISGVEQEKNEENATVQISREAQLKLQNSTRTAEPRKKAGVTSAREQFEDEAYELRCWYSVLGVKSENYGDYNLYALEDEWMRLDEPETYAKMRECWDKSCQGAKEDDEYIHDKYMTEAFGIHSDWVYRKCVTEDGYKCPLTGRSIVATLESLYSDETHDVTVDVYSENLQNADRDLWRFGTKFNVLIPAKMASELELLRTVNKLSDSEKKTLQDKCDRLGSAVSNMKEAEKAFEGDLHALKFGVKLDEGGGVTYYAKYQRPTRSLPILGNREEDIETEDSVSATSVDELLAKLKKKDEKLRDLYETS